MSSLSRFFPALIFVITLPTISNAQNQHDLEPLRTISREVNEDETRIRYNYCETNPAVMEDRTCRFLGNNGEDGYLISDLQSQRTQEKLQAGGLVLGTLAAGVGTIWAGMSWASGNAALLLTTVPGALPGLATYFILDAAGAGVLANAVGISIGILTQSAYVSTIASFVSRNLNPIRQTRQAFILRNSNLENGIIVVERYSTVEIFEEVLNKIED